MRLISWNLAARTAKLELQVDALAAAGPDVVAFQEVTAASSPRLHGALHRIGLTHSCDSLRDAAEPSVLTGPRRYGLMIASRYPVRPLPSFGGLPWPERLLSAVVTAPFGEVELHATGVPPGCTNGWTKVEVFEGLRARLARAHDGHRVLCGDLNSPQHEAADGTVFTWAQRLRPDGTAAFQPSRGARWDAAERGVLTGLTAFGLADVFRGLNGYAAAEYSWYWHGKGRRVGRRFDHVFASPGLRPTSCRYLHALREDGLSDHSAVEACFEPAH